jgi:hypothetical protein
VVVIIGFIVVTMFKRRQRREEEEAHKPKIATVQEVEVRGADTQVYEVVPQEVYVSPVEMEGTGTCAELEGEVDGEEVIATRA